MTLPRCKFCGSIPMMGKFGTKYEIYCPEMDERKCPYPPCVEGEDLQILHKQWIEQFGAGDTKLPLVDILGTGDHVRGGSHA